MYDKSDPRAQLAASSAPKPTPTAYQPASYGLFYDEAPAVSTAKERTWLTRGQNFLVAYTQAQPGAVLARTGQADEYVALLPDRGTPADMSAGGQTVTSDGYSLTIMPPGDSAITLPAGGRIARIFSTVSRDLTDKCSNASAYADGDPNIPPFKPWPAPPGGFAIRTYSLDVPAQPGRFGRIFRCTTLMVNVLDPQVGPRDITKLSPHHHDDFEQGSLAVDGSFTHHLRWPWTVDMNMWREDEHAFCRSPSLTIIPPPSIHTSRGMEQDLNQLIDIFGPPRVDFSRQPGWVLNADEYPMPEDA
ncbi:MAG: hypothetical protein H6878_00460 [Rhodobiaceae bacterium]|nr:hypothetical protein [Rhodobiaceae bacterium]MCC0041385.1 hypothetical protein [Rhodobiaceae bacterium]